jgi:aminoglycoside phosphotransferase (APT) family kinase protein
MDVPHPSASPPGLDLDRLANYLAREAPEIIDGPFTADVIAGGKSNLTYVVHGAGDTSVVLRRPPLGHVLPTAHDMGREFRVIAALNPTGFPVPDALHLCQDTEVIGAPFYIMSYVDGRVLRLIADIQGLDAVAAARTSELLVDTLARLHAIVPEEVGLGDFGRPDGYLERQVRRWYEQWGRSKTRELPSLDAIVVALRESLPVPKRTGIVHGDYRLDNVMVNQDVTAILAVLDWEMATLGDPLADLGIFMVYTELSVDGRSPSGPRFGPDQGFLSSAGIAKRYCERVPDTDIDGIGWYVALGYYKLAVISEGIHARFLQGKTVGEGFDHVGSTVPALIDRAHAALAG